MAHAQPENAGNPESYPAIIPEREAFFPPGGKTEKHTIF